VNHLQTSPWYCPWFSQWSIPDIRYQNNKVKSHQLCLTYMPKKIRRTIYSGSSIFQFGTTLSIHTSLYYIWLILIVSVYMKNDSLTRNNCPNAITALKTLNFRYALNWKNNKGMHWCETTKEPTYWETTEACIFSTKWQLQCKIYKQPIYLPQAYILAQMKNTLSIWNTNLCWMII
jgi:hypothetical protein